MILLAHSNFLAQDPAQTAKMKPYPPLSTLLVGALLRAKGFEIHLFDATFAQGIGDFHAALERCRPEVVLLMEDNFNFLTKMCTTLRRDSALAMIAAARASGAWVAVNGPDAADHPETYITSGAHAVILGEGEAAALNLTSRWATPDADIDDIKGLVLSRNGIVRRTRPRPPLHDLDALPKPAWDLIDADAYRSAWRTAHGEFSWNIAASRGCPYACNWCAKPTFGRRYSVRSPDAVVAEMRSIKDVIGPDHLWFADDILGLDVDWICSFAEMVRAQDAAIPFTMQSRVNLMTPRAVAALASAGAREVWLGIESGSQSILDAMDKGTTVEAARTATRTLKAHGIRACWFIQLGYPGEEWTDLIATRDLIREELPDEIGVSVAYPLPGTEFHRRVQAQLGRQRNWKDTGDLAMLFQGTFNTAFYRRVRDLLHLEAQTHQAWDQPWTVLGNSAAMYRSPEPFRPVAAA